MDFIKNLGQDPKSTLKVIGSVVFALIIAAVVLGTLGSVTRNSTLNLGGMGAPQMPGTMYDKEYAGAPSLSMRNVAEESYMPPVPGGGYTPGDDSESFEVKEYNATIETRNLDGDCAALRALKSRTDVIFERVSEHERGCTFTFKVKKESVEEVLGIIKNLDPRELNESAYTIKREVDDYTSEVTILENQLTTLDRTLAEAVSAYENITALATNRGDVESLAKIIESKLTIIERLTSARIETVNALERVNRAKAEALDRLEYTYMTVTVYENTFADGESIKDSWKATMQTFVRDTNSLVQDMSIGLVALILLIVKFALYFVILLVVAKYGWKAAQKIWNS